MGHMWHGRASTQSQQETVPADSGADRCQRNLYSREGPGLQLVGTVPTYCSWVHLSTLYLWTKASGVVPKVVPVFLLTSPHKSVE